MGKDCGGNPDYSPLQSIPAFWNRLFTHHSGAKYRIISTIVPTISATLHLNHFLFLLPNIKITVINISQIFALENVTTADLFFCYSLFTNYSVLSIRFTLLLFHLTAFKSCPQTPTLHPYLLPAPSPLHLPCPVS